MLTLSQVLKLLAQPALDEIVGLGADLSSRPNCDVAASAGGPYLTDAGVRRGPTWYHIVAAWARAWASFPQITLAATFVRTEILTSIEAASLFKVPIISKK